MTGMLRRKFRGEMKLYTYIVYIERFGGVSIRAVYCNWNETTMPTKKMELRFSLSQVDALDVSLTRLSCSGTMNVRKSSILQRSCSNKRDR